MLFVLSEAESVATLFMVMSCSLKVVVSIFASDKSELVFAISIVFCHLMGLMRLHINMADYYICYGLNLECSQNLMQCKYSPQCSKVGWGAFRH